MKFICTFESRHHEHPYTNLNVMLTQDLCTKVKRLHLFGYTGGLSLEGH